MINGRVNGESRLSLSSIVHVCVSVYLFICVCICLSTSHLMYQSFIGQLAVSRALGDVTFHPFVSTEPYTSGTVLPDSDAALVIACDGVRLEQPRIPLRKLTCPVKVWDVLEDQTVGDLSYAHPMPTIAARLILNASLVRSTDNISVIVVHMPNVSLD